MGKGAVIALLYTMNLMVSRESRNESQIVFEQYALNAAVIW